LETRFVTIQVRRTRQEESHLQNGCGECVAPGPLYSYQDFCIVGAACSCARGECPFGWLCGSKPHLQKYQITSLSVYLHRRTGLVRIIASALAGNNPAFLRVSVPFRLYPRSSVTKMLVTTESFAAGKIARYPKKFPKYPKIYPNSTWEKPNIPNFIPN